MNEYISDEEYSKLFLNDKDIKKIMFITGKINDMFFDIKQLFLKVEMYTLYEGNRVNKVSIFTRDKQHQVGDFYIYDGELHDYEFEEKNKNPYEIYSSLNILAIGHQPNLKKDFNEVFNAFKNYANIVHKIFRPKHKITCSIRFEENDNSKLTMRTSNGEGEQKFSRTINPDQFLNKNFWLENIHNFYNLKEYISIEDFQNEPLDRIEETLKLMKY